MSRAPLTSQPEPPPEVAHDDSRTRAASEDRNRRFLSPLAIVSVGLLVTTLATLVGGHEDRTGARLANAREPAATAPLHVGTLGPVERPAGLAVGPEGLVYAVDSVRRHVMVFDRDGSVARTLGRPAESTQPVAGELVNPFGVAVDATGRVFVSDLAARRITVFEGGVATGYFAESALEGGTPGMLAVAGSDVYVADVGRQQVLRLDGSGAVLATFVGDADDPLSYPNGLLVDDDGALLVADTNNNRLLRFSPDGNERALVDGRFLGPRGLALDGASRLYVAEPLAHRVTFTDGSGTHVLDQSDGGQALGFPTAIAIDGELMYVTDRAGHGVQVWRLPE